MQWGGEEGLLPEKRGDEGGALIMAESRNSLRA